MYIGKMTFLPFDFDLTEPHMNSFFSRKVELFEFNGEIEELESIGYASFTVFNNLYNYMEIDDAIQDSEQGDGDENDLYFNEWLCENDKKFKMMLDGQIDKSLLITSFDVKPRLVNEEFIQMFTKAVMEETAAKIVFINTRVTYKDVAGDLEEMCLQAKYEKASEQYMFRLNTGVLI